MDNVLKNYTQEEIEKLAIKQLENQQEDISFKIMKIDKEYKKHNRQTVMKIIYNGTIISLCLGVVLNSNSSISEFGTEDLTNLFNHLINFASSLPESDLLVSAYTYMFNGINEIIDKIGLVGIILASKSIKFILTTLKDTKKSLDIKRELILLNNKINNVNLENAKNAK